MKKPTREEMLSAALTVLRLGAPAGSELAKVVSEAGESDPPAKRGPGRPPKVDPRWKKEIHTCPRCGRTGPVDPMFGIRIVRGQQYKMSYCVRCRGDYYKRPRVEGRAPYPRGVTGGSKER